MIHWTDLYLLVFALFLAKVLLDVSAEAAFFLREALKAGGRKFASLVWPRPMMKEKP